MSANNNGDAARSGRDAGAADGRQAAPPNTTNISPEVAAYLQRAMQQQQEQMRQFQAQVMAQFQAMASVQQQHRQAVSDPEAMVDEDAVASAESRPRPNEMEREVAKLLRNSMGKFTGRDRRPHVLITFLRHFEKYCTYMKLLGREKGVAFSAMLTDDAAIWYQSLNRGYDWADLKQEFLRRFRDPQAEQNARVKLHQLKQTGSAKKYTEEFKRLCACISDLTEADQLQTYVHGLKTDLRIHLAVMKVKTFEHAVHSAEELDDIMFQERARVSEDRRVPKATRTEKVSRVTEKLRDRKSTGKKEEKDSAKEKAAKERKELREKGACFFCKEPGHLQAACPKKQAPKN
jgi:DNA-binding protein H-NS